MLVNIQKLCDSTKNSNKFQPPLYWILIPNLTLFDKSDIQLLPNIITWPFKHSFKFCIKKEVYIPVHS